MTAKPYHRLVIKLGTSTLTAGTPHLNKARMLAMVQQVARLHADGCEVCIVSSGAVAAGRERLGFPSLSPDVPAKQMLSAVGQSRLMHIYEDLFDIFNIAVAQVLLNGKDLEGRTRRFNARATLLTLLEHRIVPIINENDATATEEIRIGDNDNLSARVAAVIEADALLLLTDQRGLFTADPRHNSDAQLIPVVQQIDDALWALAGGAGSAGGTGGMITKLQAAQAAGRSGVTTFIASSAEPDVALRIASGESIGTRFEPVNTHLESRRRWMLMDKTRGVVRVDAGAARALLRGGASLLPVGITAVENAFERGDTLTVVTPDGKDIAYGQTNYDSDDLRKIRGAQSDRISEILGYSYGDTVIHRNNMVILSGK
jgi:glutamate 5-kinase